jgi:putative ABC transport system substrate-binding protein
LNFVQSITDLSAGDALLRGLSETGFLVEQTIPIVFVTTADPVAIGLVASFNHPGGNVTGVRLRAGEEATAKLIELVHELLPTVTAIGMLLNTQSLDAGPRKAAAQAAANSLGLKLVFAEATIEADIEPAMSKLFEANVGALLIGDNSYFVSLRDRIASIAVRERLPAFGSPSVAPDALASYGSDDYDGVRQAGIYTGRITSFGHDKDP